MVKIRVYIFPILLLLILSHSSIAQQKKEKKEQSASSINPQTETSSEFSYLPAAKSVSKEKSSKGFQLFSSKEKKKYKGSFAYQLDRKIFEYEQRMKEVAKQDRKEARISQKRKYSDHSYFGHKRKPKKRKPGKRKLCKECLIVH